MKLTPLTSIRKYCLWCCCNQTNEVNLCTCSDCPLFNLRFGKGFKGINVLKAIKARCLGCGEGTSQAVKKCEFTDCKLFAYRSGHNPARKGLGGKGRKGVNPFKKQP